MNSYPKSAQLNRFLPKSKIFEFAKPTTKVKDLFTQQVNKITIAYSLSNRSINLSSTSAVEEIQIFKIALKSESLNNEVLKCIDMAIPSPLIFELHHNGKIKTVAAFKRPYKNQNGEADTTKWVISDYFESDWIDECTPRTALPVALDLNGLYEKLLAPLMPHKSRNNESLQAQVSRMDQVHAKQRELDKIQTRLRKEKQFNKKVTINAELRQLKDELGKLRAEG